MKIIQLLEIDDLKKIINKNKQNYNKDVYESIMFYLDFCKIWFMFQQLDKVEDELINGTSDIQPKGLLSALKEKGE